MVQDRSGTLQTSEVVDALRHAGFSLDPPGKQSQELQILQVLHKEYNAQHGMPSANIVSTVVQAMVNRHDVNNTQTMSLDEFIRM